MNGRLVVLGICLLLAACRDPSTSARIPEPVLAKSVPLPSAVASSTTVASAVAPAPEVATAEPEEPAELGPEYWAGELEWARARFPELKDFTPDVDFTPLLEWVPAGKEVTLFINVDRGPRGVRCAAATAWRASDAEYINMLVPRPARFEKGQVLRSFSSAGAQREGVDFDYSFGTQRRRADGTWEEVNFSATTGADLGAHVGPVVGDTAHFRYTRRRIDAFCGPSVKMQCPGHFPSSCNLCEEITIRLSSPRERVRREPPESGICPCPPKVRFPELERIRRFAKHFSEGLVLAPYTYDVALYRTRAACLADPLWRPQPKPKPKPPKSGP